MDDNLSTQGSQLRIKTSVGGNHSQKNAKSPQDQRQKVHIKMVGENFLDKSPSEELKSDEDVKSVNEKINNESHPLIEPKKSPETLLMSPVSPKITISPKN